ncbi:MAG: hypothetical protein R2941_23430, partial [Desulfobacterales bacterium]
MTKTGITDILHFFLSVYKLQLDAPRAPGQFTLLSEDNPRTDLIYELQVTKNGKQKSRRISLGPLGEESGSKSTCCKVIYDDLLVVKIPPVPVTDFSQYVDSIRMEREIAEAIMPDIECIVPSLSAILRKIPPFSADAAYPDFEEKCIQKLRIHSRLQDYLRIGNTFVFFMNLARYTFLGQVVEGLHNDSRGIRDELRGQTEILQNPDIFDNIYGKRYASLYYPLHEMYFTFEDRLGQLQKKHDLRCIFPAYKKRQWFLTYLAERDAEPAEPRMSQAFVQDMNSLLETVTASNPAAAYFRQMVKNRLKQRNFQQNKAQISGIISNLLDMLARLRRKGIAIRDLKPDNLFIAGDSSKFPLLLANPSEYSIGLIDFETSVNYSAKGSIRQPMLAGTPSYATPSHIFKNELLKDTYSSLPRIFHLQDWQAVISMMYIVITGDHLARKTSKLLPEFIRLMKKSLRMKKMRAGDAFTGFNRVFWSRAYSEFMEKLEANAEILKSVRPAISKDVCGMLRQEISEVQIDMEKQVQKHIQSQKFFRSPKIRSDMAKASLAAIRRCCANWEQGIQVPKVSPSVREQVIRWLRGLEQIRAESERKSLFLSMLDEEKPSLSAYDLLDMMFSVVFHAMYVSKWGRPAAEPDDFEAGTGRKKEAKLSREETFALEKTV